MATVLHLFCGLGGGGLGFKRAGFHGVGAFDSSPAACRDYETLVGEPATVADLGAMSPAELRAACTGAPDVVFTSPPCKGFSGCLPTKRSETAKYKSMNSLAFRGVWLALEAWPERPPRLILLENVPRIQSRGRAWLDDLHKLLTAYGYVVSETTHDCGELGNLAQSRRRFLLVARHAASVPEVLYEPPSRPLRTIGDVLGDLPVPLPGSDAGGPMHRLPRLSPMNWLRLALIPPGGDWRDLPESVALAADPNRHNGRYGVQPWAGVSHTVIGAAHASSGWGNVEDPRLPPRSGRQNGGYGVEGWDAPSHAVLAEGSVRNTRASIADPRVTCKRREGSMGVTSWDVPSTTVIAHGTHHNGPWQCADPRLGCEPRATVYGVVPWDAASGAVIASGRVDNGAFACADPREGVHHETLDLTSKRPTHIIIRALDGTWHRPMTTLELAALQGFPTEGLHLDGRSHRAWRQRIGNAVPPPTAEAIARSMMRTLVAAEGETFLMGSTPIWVEEPCQA